MKKIVRAATLGTSLNTFCEGILSDLRQGVLGSPAEVIALASPDGDLPKLAEREHVRVIGVQMERHISPLKDIKALCHLVKVFRKEKPDMVHSMTPKAGLLCMIASWLARVPVRVHTFTGLVWPTSTGLTRRILMTTDWITCACATHVIPEGQGVLNDLAAHITSKPLKVLGYGNVKGIDLSYWDRTNLECKIENVKCKIDSVDASEDVQPFTFLFVGRIVRDKGINELVKAFDLLIERKKEKGEGSNIRLVLVGRYEEELDPVAPETRQMIDAMPEIEAVGPQYGEDLKAWYAAADCFVFPSYREGFPNTVIEAGAMELASIVTDINGSREIVISIKENEAGKNEKLRICPNGIIIPSKDAEAIYEAMCWMMEHDTERQEMGKMARKMVAERFEQGFVRQQLYDFYRQVLAE